MLHPCFEPTYNYYYINLRSFLNRPSISMVQTQPLHTVSRGVCTVMRMTGIFWWKMEGEEHEFSGEEIRTGDLSSEQIFNGIPGSDSSRSFSCGNICEIINNCVTCKYRRFRVQPQSDSLNGGGGKQENFGYRKAHCLSSYYSVFVARLAIMVRSFLFMSTTSDLCTKSVRLFGALNLCTY